jgi:hypothetical protein
LFIEVKSSAAEARNLFELTLGEWEFAAKAGPQYVIFRVCSAGDPQRSRILVLPDPYRAVQEGRMGICLTY